MWEFQFASFSIFDKFRIPMCYAFFISENRIKINRCFLRVEGIPYEKKTIQNYSHYLPMLNWRTIGGTIEINRQKLLKCSNYSPILNYICAVEDALIWNRKKICRLRNLFFIYLFIFLPIPGFEPMPYLSLYLIQATTLPTRPTITWWINVSKFCLSMNCKFQWTFL